MTIELSIFPESLIHSAIIPDHGANSILDPIFKIACIFVFAMPYFHPEPILSIILELPLIHNTFIARDIPAIAMTCLIFELPLIPASIFLYKNTSSWGVILLPVALEIWAIWVCLSAPPMSLVACSLASVSRAILEIELLVSCLLYLFVMHWSGQWLSPWCWHPVIIIVLIHMCGD